MTVRTRNWAAGIGMGLKSMVGGELKWFTSMVSARPEPGLGHGFCNRGGLLLIDGPPQMYSARNEAVSRACDECQKRGGNAIIAMRFDMADLAGFTQVCAYGTAALVEKVDEDAAEVPQLNKAKG